MYRKLTKHAVMCVLLLSSSSLYAQSPGGIGRQSIWLQGNFFSDSAQSWKLNFNPATNMDNASRQIKMPGNIEELRRATIFTVYQNTVLDEEIPVWQMNGGFGDLLFSTRQVSSKSGKMNLLFQKPAAASAKQKKTETIISTYLRQKPKSAAGTEGNEEPVIQFGNLQSSHRGNGSPGLVAEFIVYETILKEKEIARIETYLALKYGITLEKDYLNSLGKTIWNRKNDEVYSNNIAGIGRDDHSALYQKQGTSSSTTDQLTIGVNNIARSNGENTGQLNDRDYLIWGDNAQPFTVTREAKPGVSDIVLSGKKWLIKSVGKTSKTISTELKIDTKTLLSELNPKENFYIAIDRSGSGEFVPKNCSYIMADSISAAGIASFSGLRWDTDGSGQDVFSFGVKSTMSPEVLGGFAKLISFRVYPNPSADGHYNIAVTLNKEADLHIEVYDIHLRLVESRKVTGRSNYLVPGNITAAAGTYLVKLFTADKEFSQIIIKQ